MFTSHSVKIVQAQLRPEALPKPRRKRREASSVPTHGVQVAGVGDLLTQFAGAVHRYRQNLSWDISLVVGV